MVAKSERLGEHAMKRLREMQVKNRLIGEVRGKGLMIGVELVRDSKKTPADKEAARIKETLKRRGFLIGTGGLYKNVLRLQPPLIIQPQELDAALDEVESALRAA